MIEVEVKARIDGFEEIEEKLESIGAVKSKTEFQEDIYFASPIVDFAKTDEALRIRTTNNDIFITYKGPKLNSEAKTRKEDYIGKEILIENACKHNIISPSNPLTINVIIDNNKIIVTNNMSPRPIPADSTGIGLKGLQEKYRIISKKEKEIEISQTDQTFSVAIPLMSRHDLE